MAMLSEFKNYAINVFSDISSSGLQMKILIGTAAALSVGFIFFLRRRKSVEEDPQFSRLPLPPGPNSSFILAGFDFGMNHLIQIMLFLDSFYFCLNIHVPQLELCLY